MFFAWAHVFFFPFHKPNYYECAFFLAKPTTHARVVRHTILKRNGKKKPWAQTNNSLPNNHVRHNEASFNSTKWRCPYDNVTYCKFTPNRKQLPKQLPPPLHMARTWMDMHRLRRLHDSQYIMKNPFTNENSNLSNIFHNNIHRKKVESLKVRSTEEFLCQFAWLPCRFFRGRRQGRQPLICRYKYIYIYPRSVQQKTPMIGFTTFTSPKLVLNIPGMWSIHKPDSGPFGDKTIPIHFPSLTSRHECVIKLIQMVSFWKWPRDWADFLSPHGDQICWPNFLAKKTRIEDWPFHQTPTFTFFSTNHLQRTSSNIKGDQKQNKHGY